MRFLIQYWVSMLNYSGEPHFQNPFLIVERMSRRLFTKKVRCPDIFRFTGQWDCYHLFDHCQVVIDQDAVRLALRGSVAGASLASGPARIASSGTIRVSGGRVGEIERIDGRR